MGLVRALGIMDDSQHVGLRNRKDKIFIKVVKVEDSSMSGERSVFFFYS